MRSNTTPCKIPTPTVIQRGETPKNLLGRTPHTRHGVMIYSHKRLMIYTASRDYGVKRNSITLSHHHDLQGISSAIAHIERFSVYRKSQQGFISTRVIARNKVPSSRAKSRDPLDRGTNSGEIRTVVKSKIYAFMHLRKKFCLFLVYPLDCP